MNIRIPQVRADFVQSQRMRIGEGVQVPELKIQNFCSLYLADNEDFANVLRSNQVLQQAAAAGTRMLTPEEIADVDLAESFDDFTMDYGPWMGKIRPCVATRIPAFEAVKVISEWVGKCDHNFLDQSAIIDRTRRSATFCS